jgi:hypothetical protein
MIFLRWIAILASAAFKTLNSFSTAIRHSGSPPFSRGLPRRHTGTLKISRRSIRDYVVQARPSHDARGSDLPVWKLT